MKSIITAFALVLPLIGSSARGQGVIVEENHSVQGTVTYPEPGTGAPVTSPPATANVKVVADSDGDGKKDSLEDLDGDRIFDASEPSDFNNPDTDGDGLIDSVDATPKVHDFPEDGADMLSLPDNLLSSSLAKSFFDFELLNTGSDRFESRKGTINLRAVQRSGTPEVNVASSFVKVTEGYYKTGIRVGKTYGVRFGPIGNSFLGTGTTQDPPRSCTFATWLKLKEEIPAAFATGYVSTAVNKSIHVFSLRIKGETFDPPNFRLEIYQPSTGDCIARLKGEGTTIFGAWYLPADFNTVNKWSHLRLSTNAGASDLWVDGTKITSRPLNSTTTIGTFGSGNNGTPYGYLGGDAEIVTISGVATPVFKASQADFVLDRVFGGGVLTDLQNVNDLYHADTDGDGIPDEVELDHGDDPLHWDRLLPEDDYDKDLIPNGRETNKPGINPWSSGLPANALIGTNPFDYDTDGDLYGDGWEFLYKFNPLSDTSPQATLPNPDYDPEDPQSSPTIPWGAGDSDGDGLSNWEEHRFGTDPTEEDTDGDTYFDGFEIDAGSDPRDINNVPFRVGEAGPDQGGFCGAFGAVGAFKGYEGADGDRYNLMGAIGDWSGSTSERWQISANDAVFQTNLEIGTINAYRTYLRPDRVYKVTVEHTDSTVQNDGDLDYGAFVLPHNEMEWAELANHSGEGLADRLNSQQEALSGGGAGIGGDFVICNTTDYKGLLGNATNLLRKYSDTTNESETTEQDTAYKKSDAYLVPVTKSSFSSSLNISGSDATGPRFRKIGLNGRPLADEKPETEAETDQAKEETYVDAFDLSLRHDTSLIYTPLASSDLILQVSLSARESTWRDRSGLSADEEVTAPFGAGWTSNLCSYVEVTEPVGDAPTTDPISVNVVDEDGRPQRFGTADGRRFFAWPSGKTDRKSFLNTLERSVSGTSDTFTLRKKFGNTLVYRKCPTWFLHSSDRLEGSQNGVRHSYWRLQSVTDRYGNQLIYSYGDEWDPGEAVSQNNASLIPLAIYCPQRPGQRITIVRKDCRKIDSVSDSAGNKFSFTYSNTAVQGIGTGEQRSSQAYSIPTLWKVTYPDNTQLAYTYGTEPVIETVLPPPAPAGQEEATKYNWHFHLNLASITDRRGAQHVFEYAQNESVEYYDANSRGGGIYTPAVSLRGLPEGVKTYVESILSKWNSQEPGAANRPAEWKRQYGMPRLVTSVKRPLSTGPTDKVTFSRPAGQKFRFGLPEGSGTSFDGQRPVYRSGGQDVTTTVTDQDGGATEYVFTGCNAELIDQDISVVNTGGGSSLSTSTSVSLEWLLSYSAVTIKHGSNLSPILGSETYSFEPEAGYALKSATGIYGDVTHWTFGDALSLGNSFEPFRGRGIFTKWADPTSKTDALGRKEEYSYGAYRIMRTSTDVFGTTTTTSVDTLGRRTGLVVKDKEQNLLKSESYFYEHPQFKAFMTRKVVRAALSARSWEKDIETVYIPDALGRLAKETLDPKGKEISITYGYDIRNNKITSTDPNGNVTTFQYDSLNRLVKVNYPPTLTVEGLKSCSTITRYDPNGNKVVAIDENGNATIWVRDLLGRVIHEIRDMDGQGIPMSSLGLPVSIGTTYASSNITGSGLSADIVTTTVYNKVGNPVMMIDPRSFAMVTFRDAIQRPIAAFSGISATTRSGAGGAAPTVPTRSALETSASASSSITRTEMFYATPGAGSGAKQLEDLVPSTLLEAAGIDLEAEDEVLTYGGSSAFDTDKFNPYKTIRYDAVLGADGNLLDLVSYAHYDAVFRTLLVFEQFQGTDQSTNLADFDVTLQTYGDGGLDENFKESLVATTTDARGRVTTIEMDGLQREVQSTEAPSTTDAGEQNRVTTSYYSSTGLKYKVVDALLRPTETDYDSAGRPEKVWQTVSGDRGDADPDPDLDTAGIDRSLAAKSPVTITEYDKNGNVVATINPLGKRWEYQYDPRNRKTCEILPAVTDAADPDNPVSNVCPYRCTRYDGVGNVTFTRDERKNGAWSYFDRANRPTRTRVNPVNGVPSMVYALPNPADITTDTTYDAGGLVASVKDGNGNFTRNAYDALGRLVYTTTDPNTGNPPEPAAAGFNPASYQQPGSSVMLVSNRYDDAGNLTEVKDGRGAVTQFRYDGKGRKRMTTWDPGTPAAKYEAWGYDAVVLTDRFDAVGNDQTGTAGRRTVYKYDGHHLLKQVHYFTSGDTSTHADNRTLTYDLLGKLTSVTYPNDSTNGLFRGTAQRYDHLDRLIRETSATVTHAYEYDKAGNRTKTIYGGTNRTLYSEYDALNRLKKITDGGSVTWYHYDRGGKVTRKQLPNDTRTNTTHDFLGRTLTITEKADPPSGAILSKFDYSQPVAPWPTSYDGVGNVLQIIEDYSSSNVPDRTVSNLYDRTYRLTAESIAVVTDSGQFRATNIDSTEYGYDAGNNRTSKVKSGYQKVEEPNNPNSGPSVTISDGPGYTYEIGNGNNGWNSNQLGAVRDPSTGLAILKSFSYDANGNRTDVYAGPQGSALLQHLQFDGDNRLVQVVTYEGATQSYQYSYDHRTRRVVRNETAAGGAATVLSFSGGSSVQEWEGGLIKAELIRGSDWGGGVGGVLYTIRDATFAAKSYNSRGDVVSQTSGAGVVNWQAAYEAFGTRTAEADPLANKDRQRGNTKEEDPTGLLNEGMRYRDLETGVFITRDPAGFVDGPNVYTYVRQNPWSAYDPEGLWLNSLIGAGVGAIWGVASQGVSDLVRGEFSGAKAYVQAGAGGAAGGAVLATTGNAALAGAACGASSNLAGQAWDNAGDLAAGREMRGFDGESFVKDTAIGTAAGGVGGAVVGKIGANAVGQTTYGTAVRQMATGMAAGGSSSGISSIANQLIETGEISVGKTAKDVFVGSVTAGGIKAAQPIFAQAALGSYNGKTSGVLVQNSGKITLLESGGPQAGKYPATTHVEGKAAMVIRGDSSTGGVVYHNNPGGTCGMCRSNTPALLPEGAQMRIVPPRGAVATKRGYTDKPITRAGNDTNPDL